MKKKIIYGIIFAIIICALSIYIYNMNDVYVMEEKIIRIVIIKKYMESYINQDLLKKFL